MHKQIALLADDGEPLHVSITGKGSPLLLLHGWTASHAAWSPLLEQLSQRHQLIRPDARGHGGHSLSVTQTPDVARLARDVLNLLDHLGIAQATIAGHSMGALTLWHFIRDFGTADWPTSACWISRPSSLPTCNGAWGFMVPSVARTPAS